MAVKPRTINTRSDIPEFAEPESTPEAAKRRKAFGARCGHVKRRLLQHERLTGKTLELALSILGDEGEIPDKLRKGERLTDYELHLVVDVWLLHARLAG